MGELSLVKLQSFGVGSSLTWLTVDDKDSRDLRKLSKDDLVLIFDRPDNTIGQEVAISLIIFVLMQTYSTNKVN